MEVQEAGKRLVQANEVGLEEAVAKLISRREMLEGVVKKTSGLAKMVGVMTVSSVVLTGCCNDCADSCSATCADNCSGTCEGTCSGTCSATCADDCEGSCDVSCVADCAADSCVTVACITHGAMSSKHSARNGVRVAE